MTRLPPVDFGRASSVPLFAASDRRGDLGGRELSSYLSHVWHHPRRPAVRSTRLYAAARHERQRAGAGCRAGGPCAHAGWPALCATSFSPRWRRDSPTPTGRRCPHHFSQRGALKSKCMAVPSFVVCPNAKSSHWRFHSKKRASACMPIMPNAYAPTSRRRRQCSTACVRRRQRIAPGCSSRCYERQEPLQCGRGPSTAETCARRAGILRGLPASMWPRPFDRRDSSKFHFPAFCEMPQCGPRSFDRGDARRLTGRLRRDPTASCCYATSIRNCSSFPSLVTYVVTLALVPFANTTLNARKVIPPRSNVDDCVSD